MSGALFGRTLTYSAMLFVGATSFTGCAYQAKAAPLHVDVSTDWGPFSLLITGAHGRVNISPDSFSVKLRDGNQRPIAAHPSLNLVASHFAERAASRDVVVADYAIAAPPSGIFEFTLTGSVPAEFSGINPMMETPYGSMNVPPPPERAAALRLGATFADVNGYYAAPMSVFTVTEVEKPANRVTLRSENKTIHLTAANGSPFGLPQLLPLSDDRNVRALRQKFRRGKAWAIGKIAVYCGGTVDPDDRNRPRLDVLDNRMMRIKRIMRVHGFVDSLVAGPAGVSDAEEGFHFVAVDPVVIVYDRPKDACASSFWLLADPWQVERYFSPVSVDEAHPDWPASVRNALKIERVRPGMTHEMVAWARGYPLQNGTVRELNRLSHWDYDIHAKYAEWADFVGDRLVDYHGTGGWPR